MSAPPEALALPRTVHRRSRWDALRLQSAGAVARILGTMLVELKLNLLSPTPWIVSGLLAAFGVATVWVAKDPTSFLLAWRLSAQIGPLATLLILFLAASLAHRPQRYELMELLDSKFGPSEELIFGRWLGMVGTILIPLLIGYTATIIGQQIHGKPPILVGVYAHSLLRLFPSALFFGTLAFCLVTVTRILVLGAGLAALSWFVSHFGQEYFPTAMRVDLSQNSGFILGLTLAALLLMLLLYRGTRRAKRCPSTYALAGSLALVCIVTVLHGMWLRLIIPGKESSVATWRRLGGDRMPHRSDDDPLPNLAWYDSQNRRLSLDRLRGKPAILLFIEPDSSDLLPLLQRTAALRKEFAKDGLGVLVIAFDHDLSAGAAAVEASGTDLPVVTDWGKESGGGFDLKDPPSIASYVLRVGNTPAMWLLDKDGKAVKRGLPIDEANWEDVRTNVRALVAGEELPENAPAAGGLPS